MQLKKPIGATLASATCSLLGALPAAPVAAQEVPTWQVDTALLYYGEDAGRVSDGSLATSIRRVLDEDRSFSLNLTVDALTGATPNGAVPSNGVQTFTSPSGGESYRVAAGEAPLDPNFKDTRVALSGSWQQALGDSMRWNVGFSGSDEMDYLHLGLDTRLERDFNRRNTTVFVGAAYGRDEVRPLGGAPIGFSPMIPSVGGGEDDEGEGEGGETKDVIDALIGVTQILSRRSLVEVALSYGKSDGYLTDPYKILSVVSPVTGAPVPGPVGSGLNLYLHEQRPDTRTKQSVFAEWRYAFDRDSLAISYRLMDDDWGVTSNTAEARYRWNISENNYLEPHLRYYKQGAADFYRTVLFAGAPLPQFASADYRLADNETYTAGIKYGHRTERGEFSVRLEYYHQTATPSPGSAIGDLANFDLVPPLNAVIAQFGYKSSF
ncbi:MAG: DUF3570 domain-containing protein [Gammaproteobacteria bacterium]|nr:DUF3570 domain-containing protein [Gammaproteobacteria bacterium]